MSTPNPEDLNQHSHHNALRKAGTPRENSTFNPSGPSTEPTKLSYVKEFMSPLNETQSSFFGSNFQPYEITKPLASSGVAFVGYQSPEEQRTEIEQQIKQQRNESDQQITSQFMSTQHKARRQPREHTQTNYDAKSHSTVVVHYPPNTTRNPSQHTQNFNHPALASESENDCDNTFITTDHAAFSTTLDQDSSALPWDSKSAKYDLESSVGTDSDIDHVDHSSFIQYNTTRDRSQSYINKILHNHPAHHNIVHSIPELESINLLPSIPHQFDVMGQMESDIESDEEVINQLFEIIPLVPTVPPIDLNRQNLRHNNTDIDKIHIVGDEIISTDDIIITDVIPVDILSSGGVLVDVLIENPIVDLIIIDESIGNITDKMVITETIDIPADTILPNDNIEYEVYQPMHEQTDEIIEKTLNHQLPISLETITEQEKNDEFGKQLSCEPHRLQVEKEQKSEHLEQQKQDTECEVNQECLLLELQKELQDHHNIELQRLQEEDKGLKREEQEQLAFFEQLECEKREQKQLPLQLEQQDEILLQLEPEAEEQSHTDEREQRKTEDEECAAAEKKETEALIGQIEIKWQKQHEQELLRRRKEWEDAQEKLAQSQEEIVIDIITTPTIEEQQILDKFADKITTNVEEIIIIPQIIDPMEERPTIEEISFLSEKLKELPSILAPDEVIDNIIEIISLPVATEDSNFDICIVEEVIVDPEDLSGLVVDHIIDVTEDFDDLYVDIDGPLNEQPCSIDDTCPIGITPAIEIVVIDAIASTGEIVEEMCVIVPAKEICPTIPVTETIEVVNVQSNNIIPLPIDEDTLVFDISEEVCSHTVDTIVPPADEIALIEKEIPIEPIAEEIMIITPTNEEVILAGNELIPVQPVVADDTEIPITIKEICPIVQPPVILKEITQIEDQTPIIEPLVPIAEQQDPLLAAKTIIDKFIVPAAILVTQIVDKINAAATVGSETTAKTMDLITTASTQSYERALFLLLRTGEVLGNIARSTGIDKVSVLIPTTAVNSITTTLGELSQEFIPPPKPETAPMEEVALIDVIRDSAKLLATELSTLLSEFEEEKISVNTPTAPLSQIEVDEATLQALAIAKEDDNYAPAIQKRNQEPKAPIHLPAIDAFIANNIIAPLESLTGQTLLEKGDYKAGPLSAMINRTNDPLSEGEKKSAEPVELGNIVEELAQMTLSPLDRWLSRKNKSAEPSEVICVFSDEQQVLSVQENVTQIDGDIHTDEQAPAGVELHVEPAVDINAIRIESNEVNNNVQDSIANKILFDRPFAPELIEIAEIEHDMPQMTQIETIIKPHVNVVEMSPVIIPPSQSIPTEVPEISPNFVETITPAQHEVQNHNGGWLWYIGSTAIWAVTAPVTYTASTAYNIGASTVGYFYGDKSSEKESDHPINMNDAMDTLIENDLHVIPATRVSQIPELYENYQLEVERSDAHLQFKNHIPADEQQNGMLHSPFFETNMNSRQISPSESSSSPSFLPLPFYRSLFSPVEKHDAKDIDNNEYQDDHKSELQEDNDCPEDIVAVFLQKWRTMNKNSIYAIPEGYKIAPPQECGMCSKFDTFITGIKSWMIEQTSHLQKQKQPHKLQNQPRNDNNNDNNNNDPLNFS